MFSKPVTSRARRRRQSAIRATVQSLPPADLAVGRILACLQGTTDQEKADGVAWYPAATEIALAVGRKAKSHPSHTLEVGAGILAALSPQTPWDVNIVRAFKFANDSTIDDGGLLDGIRKARRIIGGEPATSVLGGRKVRSFFANIMGNGHAVTVDRHAVAIIYGRLLTDREIKVLERIGAYTYFAGCYRTVARITGYLPCEVQAITWLAWRRGHAYERTTYEGETF